MKFDKIRLSGQLQVDLPIIGAQPSDPYIIRDIDGLGPSEADVRIRRTLNAGGVYQAAQPRYKNIEISVRLNPDHGIDMTVADLRDNIYMLLTPIFGNPVKLMLMLNNGLIVATIDGYLNRVTPNLFSNDPEVQIQMDCTQAYLSGYNSVQLFKGDDLPAAATTYFDLGIPVGTAPTWPYFSYTLSQNTGSFELYHESRPSTKYILQFPMVAGGRVETQMRPGGRYVYYYPPGNATPFTLLPYLTSESRWIELYPGMQNVIRTSVPGVIEYASYLPQYQGV